MYKLYLLLIIVFCFMGSFANIDSNYTIDSLRNLYFSSPAKQKAQACFNLADYMYKNREYDSALYYSNKTKHYFESKKWTSLHGDVEKLIGNISFRRNKTQEAIDYYQQAYIYYEKANDRKGMEAIYNNIGVMYGMLDDQAKAVEYLEKSAQLAAENGDKVSEAKTLHNIGHNYERRGEYESALEFYFKALKIKSELGEKKSISATLNNIGNVYFYTKIYSTAYDYYNQAYQLSIEMKDSANIAMRLSNIGMVYRNMGRTKESINLMLESLKMYKQWDDKVNIARIYTILGNLMEDLNDNERAREYYEMSLKYNMEENNLMKVGQGYFNLSNLFRNNQEYDKSIESLNKALLIFNRLDVKREKLLAYNSLVNVYYLLNDYNKALMYADSSLAITNTRNHANEKIGSYVGKAKLLIEIGNVQTAMELMEKAKTQLIEAPSAETSMDLNLMYKNIYAQIGEYKMALNHYEKYVYQRELFNNQALKTEIADIERQYQLKEKDKEITMLQTEKVLTAQQIRNRNNLLLLSLVVLVSMASSIYVVLKAYRSKKRSNERLAMYNAQIIEQSEEIRVQRDDIEQQMEISHRQQNILLRQKKAITDSLYYAQYIQSSILPNQETLSLKWGEHFVLHLPKDIVSGDFYWAAKFDNIVYASVIDCTGHGVPGAFMSLMVYNAIQMATIEHKLRLPNEIISFADHYIEALFSNNKLPHQPDNGMDMAMCAIDREAKKIYFSGARTSMLIVSDKTDQKESDVTGENQFTEIKGDLKSAGTQIKINFTGYTGKVIDCHEGDKIYLMSDGFADQFGGDNSRKFKRSRIRNKILDYSVLSMEEQRTRLISDFYNWKGSGEQTDDVLVIGLKI